MMDSKYKKEFEKVVALGIILTDTLVATEMTFMKIPIKDQEEFKKALEADPRIIQMNKRLEELENTIFG